MNKDTAKDYLPLVQALAEGKTIQCDINGEWDDMEELSFCDPIHLYRIKPEPKKQSYRVGLFKNINDGSYFHDTIEEVNEKLTEQNRTFVRWLGDRIEYTLPEGE